MIEGKDLRDGQVLWVFAYRSYLTKTGRHISHSDGVFSAKVNKHPNIADYYNIEYDYKVSVYLNRTLSSNIHITNLYRTRQEAEVAHDEHLIKMVENYPLAIRQRIYKKLLVTQPPLLGADEVDAQNWYNNLSDIEKTHLRWVVKNVKL